MTSGAEANAIDYSRVGRPVIRTPLQGGVLGGQPDFTGTVSSPVPPNTTIHAVEGTTVIADGIRIDPVTTDWIFDRQPWGVPWPSGEHTVTVTARCGEAVSEPVTVTFTVDAGSVNVTPGGPPSVNLVSGGATGYPGVHMQNNGHGAVLPQDVTVVLPTGKRLRFVPEAGPDYQLTVMADGKTKYYIGVLSPDRQTLTFQKVDLAPPAAGATSVAWVAVTAGNDAPPGDTALAFTIGRQTSDSTPVVVADGGFSVKTGGPPDVRLVAGGMPGYPGVHLRNEGGESADLQDVMVMLPRGKHLSFVPQDGVQYELTVMGDNGARYHHIGLISSDKQSLSFRRVNVALSGRGSTSIAWLAVQADADAVMADTVLEFSVGNHRTVSNPIHITSN